MRGNKTGIKAKFASATGLRFKLRERRAFATAVKNSPGLFVRHESGSRVKNNQPR